MKTSKSVLPLTMLISAITLSGCVSDQSSSAQWRTSDNGSVAATDTSPSGIWLINSRMTEEVNQSGNEFYTEAKSRQLVVIEAIGDNLYQLHECSLNANGEYPATQLEFNNSTLRAASSYTDYDSTAPYNESENVEILLQGKEMHGMLSSYDRNLDGSYDGRQVAYVEGVKVSEAQTLDAITDEEITALLGSDVNRHATTQHLGQTCAGIASIETNGTQRTAQLTSEEVTSLLAPEPTTTMMVASSEGNE